MALTDTLDDLIGEEKIEPQLAMKILANFDRSIAEVLNDKVKARLTFKVCFSRLGKGKRGKGHTGVDEIWDRVISIRIDSATRSGRS